MTRGCTSGREPPRESLPGTRRAARPACPTGTPPRTSPGTTSRLGAGRWCSPGTSETRTGRWTRRARDRHRPVPRGAGPDEDRSAGPAAKKDEENGDAADQRETARALPARRTRLREHPRRDRVPRGAPRARAARQNARRRRTSSISGSGTGERDGERGRASASGSIRRRRTRAPPPPTRGGGPPPPAWTCGTSRNPRRACTAATSW